MIKIYKEHLQRALICSNDAERLGYLTSVIRSLLQVGVISSLEVAKDKALYEEIDLSDLVHRFCEPSDGLPLQILDVLVPYLRTHINKQFLHGWFEVSKAVQTPINQQLLEWVTFRNQRPAHGMLDAATATYWANKTNQIIVDCFEVLNVIIPIQADDGSIKLSKELGNLQIKTPILHKEKAIVFLKAVEKKGIWKLKGQLLSIDNAEEFTVDLPDDNIFAIENFESQDYYQLKYITSNKKSHSFFHNIPIRQTDIFEGRTLELLSLEEWMNDEDSRYCLVFGDGGYGKTTLVLELLNKFIEDKLNFKEPLPQIISYHTAKMTKWTENGLIHFTGITPIMDECLRELMRLFFPTLPAEWYKISGRALIDKAVGVLQQNKFNRNDVLLILDNTETLATTPQEVVDLGDFFKVVGKLIGRLIITSRRREFIPATPILIEGLSEEESVTLMRRLATEYQAKAILQAGDPRLRKISNQLMRKPILLESLVKYISNSDIGIDAALDSLFKKSNEELLEFLYEDAWVRMNPLQKEVFLLIIHVTSPLDQKTISQACQEIGIQHSEFQSSLAETHFAVLTDYGRTYSFEFVDLAKKFFLHQFGKLNDENKKRLRSLAESVDKYALDRDRIEREYKSDRVAEAFRNEFAKAAKVHVDKGEIKEAIAMYQIAIEDDPLNSALFDRFSLFLLNKTQNFEDAKIISEKAVELDHNNCDALVTLALIYYRLKDISNGDKYLDLAKEKGRPLSFCLLRKAIARYHQAKTNDDLSSAIEMLIDAQEKLNSAEQVNKNSTGNYHFKNQRDIKQYQDLTKLLLSTFRTKQTKSRSSIT